MSALTLVLAPSLASASSHSEHPGKVRRTARALDSHPCSKPAVEVVAGSESATFPLERCDGEPIPASIDKLSILARPAGAAKPKEPLTGKPHGAEVAPGIRRIDARLAERLELVADHFRKEGEPTRIVLVAPKSRSAGSYHASGRALDFRIEGADNDAVVAFCKTVQDTGCGYYPNGGFVHMDVRDAGAGHVSWIDVSKAGRSAEVRVGVAAARRRGQERGPRNETAKAETAKSEAREAEASKAEAGKTSAKDETRSCPALPAAAAVAPMADPPSAPGALTEPAPGRSTIGGTGSRARSHTI